MFFDVLFKNFQTIYFSKEIDKGYVLEDNGWNIYCNSGENYWKLTLCKALLAILKEVVGIWS